MTRRRGGGPGGPVDEEEGVEPVVPTQGPGPDTLRGDEDVYGGGVVLGWDVWFRWLSPHPSDSGPRTWSLEPRLGEG